MTQKVTLDWFVKQSDDKQTLQSIRLGLLRECLVSEAKSQAAPAKKEGGNLNYSQIFNGKIAVSIMYPSIDEADDTDPKSLGIFSPQDITEDLVSVHIHTFLKEMTQWQKREQAPSRVFI